MSDFMAYDADDEKIEPDDDFAASEPVEPIESIEPTEGPVDSTFDDDDGDDAGQPAGTDGAEPAPAAAPAEPADERNWFVIHCYSGYENKVRHNLEQRIESMGMKGKIFDVVVPTEEEIEVKDGKRRTVERRVFPGYLLVQMIMSEESWYVVRNTPGVTGFVGMGNTPTALRPEEVAQILRRMEAEAPKVKVTFKPSQKVRIVDGPFNDFIGTVAEIDMDRAKVRVMVSFFGRETPVELDFLQVEKV
jgi:transcription termination/antitermination protein NusG